MEPNTKLKILATQMHLEPAEETHIPRAANGDALPCAVTPNQLSKNNTPFGIHPALMPNGKRLLMLKTMQTSACERNCYYCPFRAGRSYRRVTFKPEELANTFMDMHRAGLVQGMFLSSGIIGGGMRTQDKLLDTAEILRRKHGYRGYLHLKIMPGAERDQVQQAMRLADRLSVNLEAPNTKRLQALAPRKQFIQELLAPLRWIHEIRRTQPAHLAWNGRWPSSVTQFVVGGVGESDLELLTTANYLYKHTRLARVYFSAFHPIRDTPMENLVAENPVRQQRLYQASFLLRDYGFDLEALPFATHSSTAAHGNLPLDIDPKLAWAQLHLQHTPLELNHATRHQLLRIPGIGLKSVQSILTARQQGRLKDLHDLRKLGLNIKRVTPFILLNGKRPPRQLSLW